LSVSHFSRGLKEKGMSEILIFLGIFLVWVLLQMVILPKFGIST
jgi:hypothetical protein